ncbi:DNA-directed RNA polymerase I subunit 1 [Nymphaea thermarum]|nr:DNA-directed RNA polymerase I subunit 1 [Nymphaea thermarum]
MHSPHAKITNDECEEAFENKFVPLLKKAVDKYLDKMSKSGEAIEIVSEHPEGNVMEKAPDENEPENESIKGEGTKLDEDDGEDEGADAQKKRKQSEDDIEYGDEKENELFAIEDVNSEDDEMVGSGKEGDEVEDGLGTCVGGDGNEMLEEVLNDVSKNLPAAKYFSGSKFAEKVAMNVFIRTVEGMDDCSLIIPKGFGNKTNSQLNPGRKLKKQLKNMPEDLHEKTKPIKLQTRGVNFSSLWRMQDELDIRKLCSNDINAMLEKYGVEAARETIVAEIRAVFEHYGIRPDIRHLSLIADFMTFDGQYRPMNRFDISSSVSPFLKITFETATNFLVHMNIVDHFVKVSTKGRPLGVLRERTGFNSELVLLPKPLDMIEGHSRSFCQGLDGKEGRLVYSVRGLVRLTFRLGLQFPPRGACCGASFGCYCFAADKDFSYRRLIKFNFLYNDINAMLEKYGVEAARATIVAEIRAVFERSYIDRGVGLAKVDPCAVRLGEPEAEKAEAGLPPLISVPAVPLHSTVLISLTAILFNH